MRALEVAVYLNNSSMEEMVCSDALPRERGEMAKRMTELEAELAALKKGDSEKDKMIAFLEEKADSASRYYNELKEVRTKFAAEKKVLEDALLDASFFGEDETEDTTELAAIEELERNLVGAARHGFDNAVDQLKVVNPGVEFCVDGIHFLKYVRNGKIVSQDDDENDGNSQAYTAL